MARASASDTEWGGLAALGLPASAPPLLVERGRGVIAECSGFIVHSLQSAISAGRRRVSAGAKEMEESVQASAGAGRRRREGAALWHEAWGLSLKAQTPCFILLKLLNKAAVHIGVRFHTLTMHTVVASYRREYKLVPKVLSST